MTTINALTDPVMLPRPVDVSQMSIAGPCQRIRELGIPDEAISDVLTVPSGTTLYLSTEPGYETCVTPRLLMTNDLAEYKRWIGRPDDSVSGESYWAVPAPWSGRSVSQAAELTPAEMSSVESAGWIYLFGDSRQVTSYREVLETLKAPFLAAAFAIRHVRIQAGGSLIVRGLPAVLVIEHLLIEDGGQLVTYSPTHGSFGLVEKRVD